MKDPIFSLVGYLTVFILLASTYGGTLTFERERSETSARKNVRVAFNKQSLLPNNSISTQLNDTFVVIQRRIYGTVSFNRGWQDYKRGFGVAQGDFWAGLDYISQLTTTGYNKLRIDMMDWYGNQRTISYLHFVVLDESNYYKMYVSGYSGPAANDDLTFNSGMYFYTPDRPDINNCAVNQKGGWWYNYCSYALPNGLYYYGGPYRPTGPFYDGIYWKDWLGYAYSLKFFSMSLYK